MFSDFLMTEYGLISIFKVRIMYGLKTAKILVRVCDGVRVTFKIEAVPVPVLRGMICTYIDTEKLSQKFLWVSKFKYGYGIRTRTRTPESGANLIVEFFEF